MSPMQTKTTTTSASHTHSAHSPCGCQDHTPAQACCCNLVCFDRPNYFCGHLLTDADLTLQQKYVVEKNKLYHRTMDGYGVVCGLKLTCDCDCKGNILIHDGFAIDDCGNDLVVCETTRFDVIEALKCKGLLVTDPPEDECEPRRHKSRCDIKQCFYITICYDETESEYETPFQSSCTAGPKQCMPTRTHEGVRFDVTDKLPPKHSYLEDLEERIKHCFEVHCDSPVGVIMKRHVHQLQYILGAEQRKYSGEEKWRDPCELFCTLRAYFLNHLKLKPDEFNCGLVDEVSSLTCPRECREDYDEERRERHGKHRDEEWQERHCEELEREHDETECEEEWRLRYREELREAFRKLLYCIERYQYDCVFGDLIFSCQQPCEAHCLVLGTVEVLNGKLVRVCNTPRRYLWAPANLLQVLIYDSMTGRHTSREDCEGHRVPCCPDYRQFEPTVFLKEFEINKCGRRFAATSLIESLRTFRDALHHSFDFTDSMAIAAALFASGDEDELRKAERYFGISASVERNATALNPLTLPQALQSHALLRRDDSLLAYESEGGRRQVQRDFLREITPDRSVGAKIEAALLQITKLTDQVRQLEDRISREGSASRDSSEPTGAQ